MKRISYAPKHTTTRRMSPGNGEKGLGLFGSSYERKMSSARVSNESSKSTDMNMAPCRNSYGPPPPSTIKKKKGRSRLFHNDDDDDMGMNRGGGEGMNVETKFKFGGEDDMKDDEEDVSPRDALDFPFFTASSSSPKRPSQKENSSLTSSTSAKEGDCNNKSYEAVPYHYTITSMDVLFTTYHRPRTIGYFRVGREENTMYLM